METKVFVQIDEQRHPRSEPGIPPQQELRQKSPLAVVLSTNGSLPTTARLESFFFFLPFSIFFSFLV